MVRMLEKLRGDGLRPGTALWLLGSPNNPTGQLVDPAIIRYLLDQGETVALDEAFMDFVPDADRFSFLREATIRGRLIVIRSLTKFYVIPGIRLGYMTAAPSFIAELKALQVPWSVNSLAQLIGEAVLDEREYRERTMEWLVNERQWLAAELARLGLIVHEGAANYLLFSISAGLGWTAGELQRALGARGILIRDASHFSGLDGSFCRIAVRFRDEHDRLLRELRLLFGQADE